MRMNKEVEKVKQHPLRPHMAGQLTNKELVQAVEKLKSGKAGGSSGILPEMVKAAYCK